MRVVILSGSGSDGPWVDKIAAVLDTLEVPYLRRVGSAHRVPEHVLNLLASYDGDDVATVFITVAGMSDALSGLTDANVASPVIACPPASDSFSGLDILSSLRTPPGVAPATALLPANAAIVAAKILGLHESDLGRQIRANVVSYQEAAAAKVMKADVALGNPTPNQTEA